jgi:ABC-type multidrug transport system fused ATPase/permease subunit
VGHPPRRDVLRHVVLVTQEHHVFVGTLRENLALAAPSAASDGDIRDTLAVRRTGGATVIAIAHRLVSAHDADRVAVVADGRIAELGSHDELVAAGGSYAALWDSWHGRGADQS